MTWPSSKLMKLILIFTENPEFIFVVLVLLTGEGLCILRVVKLKGVIVNNFPIVTV